MSVWDYAISIGTVIWLIFLALWMNKMLPGQKKKYSPLERHYMKSVLRDVKLSNPETPADVLVHAQSRDFEFEGSRSMKVGRGKYEHDITSYYWSHPMISEKRFMVLIATWEYRKLKFEATVEDHIPVVSSRLPTGEPKP